MPSPNRAGLTDITKEEQMFTHRTSARPLGSAHIWAYPRPGRPARPDRHPVCQRRAAARPTPGSACCVQRRALVRIRANPRHASRLRTRAVAPARVAPSYRPPSDRFRRAARAGGRAGETPPCVVRANRTHDWVQGEAPSNTTVYVTVKRERTGHRDRPELHRRRHRVERQPAAARGRQR